MKILKSTDQEYTAQMRLVYRDYPKGMARARSISLQEAKKIAQEQRHKHLLPKGRRTPNHYFYTLFQEDKKIGYLWLHKQNDHQLFICNIYIFSRYRSKSYGTRTVKWIQSKAKRLGCTSVLLHVFGHNRRAIEFYEKCGFFATNVYMRIDSTHRS